MSLPQQEQQHQHQQGTANSTQLDLDDVFFGATDEENGPHNDVTYKEQVREELLSASLATAAAAAAPPRRRAGDIHMVNDAEAEEDRLHDVERRALHAPPQAPHRRHRDKRHDDVVDMDEDDGYDNDDRLQDAERRAATAEAARRDQEVRFEELIVQLASVLPLPSPPDVMDDEDEENASGKLHQQRKQQVVGKIKATTKVEHTAIESASKRGNFSPKQPQRQRRRVIVAVAVAVLIAAAGAVAGICGTGLCSSPTKSPLPPLTPSPTPSPVLQLVVLPQPVPQPVPPPVAPPVPLPQPVPSTMPTTANAPADTILSYINIVGQPTVWNHSIVPSAL
jgi:hypothetical protein